jgi:hypothetical protein
MTEHVYANGEANFGPPAERELSGGAHLVFDLLLRHGDELIALRRPEGYHDGPKDKLYGPHGLICFGETVEECVQRLVDEQGSGVRVTRVDLYTMPTWVDENNHWHIALNVIATIDAIPTYLPPGVSEIVRVRRGHPGSDFAWFSDEQLEEVFDRIATLSS